MKTKQYLWFALSLVFGVFVLFTSFSEPYRNWKYVPVFMKRADLDQSVTYQAGARDLKSPGKIYCKAPYIFVNEKYKGIHVIDNSNPQNPVNVGFIVAPGCIDMAVEGNILYLDNAVDLVAFDLNAKQVTKRIKNVFPEPLSPDNRAAHQGEDRAEYVVVEWKENINL